jgi:uncharacterized membrane protein YkvA (DUF1232 family)
MCGAAADDRSSKQQPNRLEDPMGDDNTVLMIIVGFFAIILLIAVVLLAISLFVIYRYRVPLRGVAAMAGALVYLVSPVDVLPEVVLGPFGLIDDLGVVGGVGMFVYRLIQARRQYLAPSGKDSSDPDHGTVRKGKVGR